MTGQKEREVVRTVAREYLAEESPEELSEFDDVFESVYEAVLRKVQAGHLYASSPVQRRGPLGDGSSGEAPSIGLPMDLSFVSGTAISSVIWFAVILVREALESKSAARQRLGSSEDSKTLARILELVERIAPSAAPADVQDAAVAAVAEAPSLSAVPLADPGSPSADDRIDLEIDISLGSAGGKTTLNFELRSPSKAIPVHRKRIHGEALQRDPEAIHRDLFDKIEGLHRGRDSDGSELLSDEALATLSRAGNRLYRELFPADLKRTYRSFRHRVRTLQITSQEPWIPWELVKPYDDSDPNDIVDDDFLCMQFRMTRWLDIAHPAPERIRVTRLACIEAGAPPGMKPLPCALEERKAVTGIAESHPQIEDCSPKQATFQATEKVLAGGTVDLFHFVGHADEVPDNPDATGLRLMDKRALRPSDLEGRLASQISGGHPLVFLNACRTGEQGWSLTGLGGWANAWVNNCRCSCLIAPQWAINDRSALRFAEAFYDSLLAGKTLGEAAQEARRAARQFAPGRLTWLAYAVYGNPNARLSLAEDGAVPAPNLEPVKSPPENRGSATTVSGPGIVDQLRRLSAVAASDAGFVTGSPFDHQVLLDDIYVRRDLEKELINQVRRGECSSAILVVGESGHGKTSLLWRAYQVFREEKAFEPWFFKSTWFLTGHRSIALPELAKMARAVQALRRQQRRPLILLDSIDLLLHNEGDRGVALELLSTLTYHGATVVAACRPREAHLLFPVTPIRRLLKPYSKRELQEAIEKHYRSFYRGPLGRTTSERLETIQEAVSQGLPVREVCLNPLTLKMLFFLYSPGPIPKEIHVAQLYRAFWDHRVQSDSRAGDLLPSRPSRNLQRAAATTALTLLAEGVPEVDCGLWQSRLEAVGLPASDADALQSRGVLRRSDLDTISFFHQTFFEHCAARGLLSLSGGMKLVKDRVQALSNDLFLRPIYEQTLLLSGLGDASRRRRGDELLIEMLSGSQQADHVSAIYVYTHSPLRPSPSLSKVVADTLEHAESAVVNRFVESAPNIDARRIRPLLSELETVWTRGSWGEQERVLEALSRIVTRDPIGVKGFIVRQRPLQTIKAIGVKGGSNAIKDLVLALNGVAHSDSKWAWAQIMYTYRQLQQEVRNRVHHAVIVRSLASNADLYGRQSIATRFFTDPAPHESGNIGAFDELAEAAGELWEIEWTSAKWPWNEIFQQIEQAAEPLIQSSRFFALAAMLPKIDEAALPMFEAHYERVKQEEGFSIWSRIVFRRVLLEVDQDPVDGLPRMQAPRFLWKEMSRVLETTPRKKIDRRLLRLLRAAFHDRPSGTARLLRLLQAPCFSQPECWLDASDLAPVVVAAWEGGHRGAEEALSRLVVAPQAHTQSVVKVVRSDLVARISGSVPAQRLLLELSAKTKDETGLAMALEAMAENTSIGSTLVRAADELRGSLIDDRNPKRKSAGVRIWCDLVRRGLTAAPEFADLHERIETEGDPIVQSWMALLIGISAKTANYDLENVFLILHPLALNSANENLREKALESLVIASTRTPASASQFANRVLEIALTPPTNAKRLGYLRDFLVQLVPDYNDRVFGLLEKSMNSPVMHELTQQQKRSFVNRLRTPFRDAIALASKQQRQHILSLVPKLDRFLGRLIVDAICHESFAEDKSILEKLQHSDAPSEIIELIGWHKYFRERTQGGTSWPELNDLIQ